MFFPQIRGDGNSGLAVAARSPGSSHRDTAAFPGRRDPAPHCQASCPRGPSAVSEDPGVSRIQGYLPAPLPWPWGPVGPGQTAGTLLLAGLRSSECVLLLLSFSLCCFSFWPFFFSSPFLFCSLALSFRSVFSFLVLCCTFSSSFTIFLLPFLSPVHAFSSISLCPLFICISHFHYFSPSAPLLCPGSPPQGRAHPPLQVHLRVTGVGGPTPCLRPSRPQTGGSPSHPPTRS